MLIKNKKGEIKEIIYDEKQLYNYGINRFSERDYGRQELLVKMKRLQPDLEIVNKVLDKLEAQDYISDAKRAKSLFNQFSHKESINKTIQRIKQIGISKDTIDDVIEEKNNAATLFVGDDYDEEDIEEETKNAIKLLNNKFRFYDILKKDKMVRFLVSKGYRYNNISKAIVLFSQQPED